MTRTPLFFAKFKKVLTKIMKSHLCSSFCLDTRLFVSTIVKDLYNNIGL